MKNLVRNLLALTLLFAAEAVAKAEEILLQSVQSGLYVTAVNGTLANHRTGVRTAWRHGQDVS